MNQFAQVSIKRTDYDRKQCQIGIVHLGFGAFHRAHQAVYIDNYMQASGDFNWGIAAVNLRAGDRETFRLHNEHQGYLLKTTTPEGVSAFKEVRSHIHFQDWSEQPETAEKLLELESVKVVSITVTESGYYLNDDWTLNAEDPTIAAEISGAAGTSIYAYLSAALTRRKDSIGHPISVLCCDNIRSNGRKLGRNFLQYLSLTGQDDLLAWTQKNVTFPNSMVDRITPRSTQFLKDEITAIAPNFAQTAIHGESFTQWVLEDNFAAGFPALDKVGVEFVEDVDPYEEAKIRILNGGHTALCYLGALAGHETFDEAMRNPELKQHFDAFENENVLPGLTLELPFSKADYVALIAKRFANAAIADDLGRICMDGWSKFPIFVRPTIKSCLAQGIDATSSFESIASWYVYARRFANGQTHVQYIEPYWDQLEPLLTAGREDDFARTEALWSDLPQTYPNFATDLTAAIARMEEKWPA